MTTVAGGRTEMTTGVGGGAGRARSKRGMRCAGDGMTDFHCVFWGRTERLGEINRELQRSRFGYVRFVYLHWLYSNPGLGYWTSVTELKNG